LLENVVEMIAVAMMIGTPRAAIVVSSHILVSPKKVNQIYIRVKNLIDMDKFTY